MQPRIGASRWSGGYGRWSSWCKGTAHAHALQLSIRWAGIETGQSFITKLLLFSHATIFDR
jgi:hypothetical protein